MRKLGYLTNKIGTPLPTNDFKLFHGDVINTIKQNIALEKTLFHFFYALDLWLGKK